MCKGPKDKDTKKSYLQEWIDEDWETQQGWNEWYKKMYGEIKVSKEKFGHLILQKIKYIWR